MLDPSLGHPPLLQRRKLLVLPGARSEADEDGVVVVGMRRVERIPDD